MRNYKITLKEGKQLMFCDRAYWSKGYGIIYYKIWGNWGKLITENVDACMTIRGDFPGSKVRAYNELYEEIIEQELKNKNIL